jgi:predicted Zn-dependent protease with MMP-like domain
MHELPPSLDDIESLARKAWTSMPENFRKITGDLVFRIEDFASDEILNELEIEDPYDLTGLYQGVDLTQRSLMDAPAASPLVFLYRRPLLDEWIDRGDIVLGDLVAHVLVHEIGHHFGFSDEQMDELLEAPD